MEPHVNRRDFLKYAAAAGTLMTTADVMIGTAMSHAQTSTLEVERLEVWVLTDNYYDALRPDNSFTKRYRVVPGKSIHAEHGLSYFIRTTLNGKTSGCMFDYGLDPVGVLNNLHLLGIDLGKADAFTLSHGHYDHYMAAVDILKHHRADIRKGVPFYVGAEAFCRRFSVRPGSKDAADLGQLDRKDLENLGVRVVEITQPTEIIPGAYFTGNIERVTGYEKVPPSLLIQRGGGPPEPDDFRGEQALFFNVKGKGLVVLSGCAHAGIVNTVRQAQKVSGIEKVHAVMGGFHLINAKPDIIRQTVADIRSLKPDVVAPTHCTGFEAIVQFMREMPSEFTINTAGTKYTFAAA
jgi:7,8-dihydropterin-6-yl-methyl-4-(beta-D-ribofuranosyl)aminobenzene 5'-phosphate synthase